MQKFLRFLKFAAISLGSSLLLFFFINILFWVFFTVKDNGRPIFSNEFYLASIKKDLGEKYLSFRELFPDLKDSELETLLREMRSRSLDYEGFTEFKELPFKGRYLNIDPHGFRMSKDQGPWPPDPHDFAVFVFGGSTTFGVGLPDDQTIVSCLQETMQKFFVANKLRCRVCLYNFGNSFYYSSQELVLYEKLLRAGFVPNMAIFIDGLNDFYTVKDQPRYTEEFRGIVNAYGRVRHQALLEILRSLPVCRFMQAVQTRIRKFNHDAPKETVNYDDPHLLQSLINRYLENKKMIEAVSEAYQIIPVFVWQPVPTYQYNLDHYLFLKGGFELNTYSMYGYPLMEETVRKKKLGDDFLWCADIQRDSDEILYLDKVHYTAAMSRKIAARICDLLVSRKLIPQKFFN